MSVFDRVRRMVAEAFQVPIEDVTADTNLHDYSDSLGVVEMVMGIEEEFDIEIPDDVAARFEAQELTVGDLAAYIEEQLRPRGE